MRRGDFRLEALSVHDRWSTLVVLLLGDPEVLESTQTGKNTSSDPDRVFTFWRSDNLDLHAGGRETGRGRSVICALTG